MMLEKVHSEGGGMEGHFRVPLGCGGGKQARANLWEVVGKS